MTDSSSTDNLLGTIITDAFAFATPFAQKALGQSSTPQDVQAEKIRTATLNGSGPNDPTLARQSPLTLTDFLTGGRVNGIGTNANTSGLSSGSNLTWIGLAIAAIAVVLVILKR